jgi:phasin family protein
MPDTANTSAATKSASPAAKPAEVATPPSRQASVPTSATAPKPTALAPSTPAAAKAVKAKPAVAKAAPVVVDAKPAVPAKRGRPLGSKTKTPAAKPVVAAAKAKPAPRKPIVTPTKPVAPLAVATPSEGSKPMTDTITKMQDAAKTFTGDAGARTQAMFGDLSGRAKGAYEKSVKMTEELTAFQKGNVEAIVESSKLAAKAAETLGQSAADYARKSFESGTAALKTFASAKSPTELFKLQSDYLKSYFDSAVAESSKVTEAWLKLAGDVAQPLSNRVAVAVEKAKATAAF